MSAGEAIGIDLGTTFSCVGIFQGGRVEIIANTEGHRTTPNCVAFTAKERLIGDAAKSQAVMNPANTVFDVKRLMGRSFNDEAVQGDTKHWPFKVINSDGKPMIEVEYCSETRKFHAEQISSMVLSRMKETVEAIDAGRIAGLKVLRLINELTAAAIAHGMDKGFDRQRNVLIFDWGGGTFDVSILSIENGRIEVKAVGGDTHLGGEDIGCRLVDHFLKRFEMEHEGKDLTSSKKAISRLRRACERAKRLLNSAEYTYMDVDSLFKGINLSVMLTRAQLEQLCLDLFNAIVIGPL
ncbi:Heat shock cognate 70 kDa protein [Taenia solium]|eukprot:TsM_001076700 transcript=TsM_001076700 gene=TsM_001076700